MKKRATDTARFFVKYEGKSGKILGCYNNFTHSTIPQPNIEVSDWTIKQIVKTPSAYKVDISSQKVVQIKSTEYTSEPVPESRAIIGRGVEHEGYYYPADSEASAYFTQCLTLSFFDTSLEFEVPAYKDGQVTVNVLGSEELFTIVHKINSVRKYQFDAILAKESDE